MVPDGVGGCICRKTCAQLSPDQLRSAEISSDQPKSAQISRDQLRSAEISSDGSGFSLSGRPLGYNRVMITAGSADF